MPVELNSTAKKKLRARLKKILSRASDVTVEALLESVLKPVMHPTSSLAARLLSEKCTPNEIHLALIFCRNALLMIQVQSSEAQGFKTISRLLAQHDRMTSFLMQAIEHQHEQEWKALQAEVLREGHANLLNRAVRHWSEKREITIYSYYREMPVSQLVKFIQAGGNSFTTENRNELAPILSASSDRRSAYTHLPDSELSIQIIVEETTRNTLHWQYGEFSPLAREKRRDIRVQSSTPIHISLKGSDQEQWSGSVMDISVLGLGISCRCDSPFQVGDMLAFSMTLEGDAITGKGAVCWVQGSKGHYRAGLAVEHKQKNYVLLSKEVQRKEKNLMGELKLKGIPDCLIAD